MEITPKPPTAKGPAAWFTGDVFLDGIVRGEEPSHVRVSAVRFTPSARTAWHSHAVGQTLYVTEGRGLVQSRGGGIAEIRAGDIVRTPADEWHWHGAADPHVPPADVTAFAAGMNHAGADWQLIMYGRAQHGFTHQHAVPGTVPAVAYDRLADERSFAAARAFLAEALAS